MIYRRGNGFIFAGLPLFLVAGTDASRGFTVSALLGRAYVHNVGVNGARHTVLSLDIKLRGFIVGEGTVVHDITLGRGIHHVADHETLGGLVLLVQNISSLALAKRCIIIYKLHITNLRAQAVALVAPHTVYVSAARLVASSVSSLLRHSAQNITLNHNTWEQVGNVRSEERKRHLC